MSQPVSLQISVAPTDLPHARVILPHQLRQLGGQVDEVVVTVDTYPGGGRFAAEWANREAGLAAFLADLGAEHQNVRIAPVDYSEAAAARVAEAFFAGQPVPRKDYRGGPFYCYFYGLLAPRHDLILHVDCDMLFGGGSQQWVSEALEILTRHPEVLACNPLPGPPTRDRTLNAQHFHTQRAEPDPEIPHAFRFPALSTRLYLLDRRRLAAIGGARFAAHLAEGAALAPPTEGLARVDGGSLPARVGEDLGSEPIEGGSPPVSALRPRLRDRLARRRRPPAAFPPMPERMISLEMQRAELVRLDFLGSPPGMWAVHPWARDEDFYALLPGLVERIERGDVTEDQRGTQELSLGMLRRRRGYRFYRRLPAYRHLVRVR